LKKLTTQLLTTFLCIILIFSTNGLAFAAAGDAPGTVSEVTATINGIPSTGGTVPFGTTVTLQCATEGATIVYTLDGTEPSADNGTPTNGIPYPAGATIEIKSNVTIRAIATKFDMNNSLVTNFTYNLQTQITQLAPVTAVSKSVTATGTGTTVEVTLSAEPNAQIYYTLDNTPATGSNGRLYSAPIILTKPTAAASITISAVATKTGMSDSVPATFTYTSMPTVTANPTPQSGAVASGTKVTLSCPTADKITYTLNGSDPTAGSTVYTAAIPVTADTTIKAIGVKAGFFDSNVATFTYKLTTTPTSQVAAVTANPTPQNGAVASGTKVYLSCPTSGAAIRYTTDNTTPSKSNGKDYVNNTPIVIDVNNTVIQAIATKTGMSDSAVAKFTYTLTTNQVAAVTANPKSGTAVESGTRVILSCATAGATIKYTLDGTTPANNNGTVYNASTPIIINTNNTTIKAVAIKSGLSDSPVATFTYPLTTPVVQVAAITANPPDGAVVTNGTVVYLTCATTGAKIRYTLNGATPTANSTLYSAPIPINAATTIKAVAIKSGLSDSPVATFTYRLTTPVVQTAAVIANPPDGAVVTNGSVVYLTCATTGAKIRYTLNGATPTANSTLYSAPIPINAATTIRAIAGKSGLSDSPVATFRYTLTNTNPTTNSNPTTSSNPETNALLNPPSDWAKSAVVQAIQLGLVPDSLQNNYTKPATRLEFCAIAVQVYEKTTGSTITARKQFADTNDINVAKMAGLNIVSGMGNNKFAPHEQITREQAAVILTNLLQALDSPPTNTAPSFADKNRISPWAISAVGNVQAQGIMNGVGNNQFAPRGLYTREQSIATLLRIYNSLN